MSGTLTRRGFLLRAGAAIAAAGGRDSAVTSVGQGMPAVPPPHIVAPTLIGYGLVNAWHHVEAIRFAALLAANGLTLTEIEYVPWFDETRRPTTSLRTYVERARQFVDAMRPAGITTLIAVTNWNGVEVRAQSTAWFRERIEEIVNQVGSDQVLLLPVSEPDASGKSVEWTRLAYERWPGRTVGNGPGGRGTPVVPGYDYMDWHWCEDFTESSVRVGNAINNTDCGPVLNPGAQRVARMTRVALDRHAHFLVYDHHGQELDEAVIAGMGVEVRQ